MLAVEHMWGLDIGSKKQPALQIVKPLTCSRSATAMVSIGPGRACGEAVELARTGAGEGRSTFAQDTRVLAL